MLLAFMMSIAIAEDEPEETTSPFADVSEFRAVYDVAFDMDAVGDKICGLTGLCDCTAQYKAGGKKVAETDGSVTFEGTWTASPTECNANFAFWAGGDEKAFHTFRWNEAGQVTEWVVHKDQANSEKRTEGVKKSGQYWIDDLALDWSKGKEATATQQSSGDIGKGVMLANTHTISITFDADKGTSDGGN